jgi:hypothetical protein
MASVPLVVDDNHTQQPLPQEERSVPNSQHMLPEHRQRSYTLLAEGNPANQKILSSSYLPISPKKQSTYRLPRVQLASDKGLDHLDGAVRLRT